MSPEEAAREFWDTVEAVRAHRPTLARYDRAAKVIKAHMAARGTTTFRGIELVESDGGRRLDQSLAQAKYGDQLEDCFVRVTRRSLEPKRRPRAKR